MNILNECSFLKEENIKKIEETYNGTYVFELCLYDKTHNNWYNFPAAIFYTETPHPKGSNYFAIYYDFLHKKYMIADGITATQTPIAAIQIEDDIIYSRYRHDYRIHKGTFIDGGRDYTKYGGTNIDKIKIVKLKVEKDKLVLDETT